MIPRRCGRALLALALAASTSGGAAVARGASPYPPVIGPAQPISEPAYVPESTHAADAAWSGAAYLVVYERDGDVYGTRVLPDGTLLDPFGFAISTATYDQIAPRAVWNGEAWFVLWEDAREKGDLDDLYGARVTEEGVVLDPDGIPLAGGEGLSGHDLVWTGSQFLVAWTLGCEVFVGRFDADAAPLDPQPALLNAAECGGPPSIAWSGSLAMVVWSRNGAQDVRGARVSEAGVVLDNPPLAVATEPNNQSSPHVVQAEDRFFAVWQDFRHLGAPGFGAEIYGTYIEPDGTVVSAHGMPIADGSGADHELSGAASNGTQVLVLWREDAFNDSVRGTIVNGDALTSVSIVQTSGEELPAGLGTDGNEFLAVYSVEDVTHETFGQRLGPDGSFLGSIIPDIVMRPAVQEEPALATDLQSLLALWYQSSEGSLYTEDLQTGQVGLDGEVLSGDGQEIARGVLDPYPGNRKNRARLVFAGTNYLALHMEAGFRSPGSGIYAQAITPSGFDIDGGAWLLPIPAGGLPVADDRADGSTYDPHEFPCALASSGAGALVACHVDFEVENRTRLYLARFDAAGTLLDPAGLFLPLPDYAHPLGIAAAWNGESYTVVWGQDRDDAFPEVVVKMLTIGEDGRLRGAAPRVLSEEHPQQAFPALACSRGQCLATWRVSDGSDDIDQLRGARFDPAGNRLDAALIPVDLTGARHRGQVMAWDGRAFLIAWKDPTFFDRILAARVSGSGEGLDEDALVLSAEGEPGFPAMTGLGGGRSAISWAQSQGSLRSVGLRFIDECAPSGDSDGDAVPDSCDACPQDTDADQADADGDSRGDVCDPCPGDPGDDADADGICAGAGFDSPFSRDHDNCPGAANADQADGDGDKVGDACDDCPRKANADQADQDGDSTGDLCDFTQVAPAINTVLLRDAAPPVFTWLRGKGRGFRVELSETQRPFVPVFDSGRTLLTDTRWKPSGRKWRRLAEEMRGRTLFWRVVGKFRGSADLLPTGQEYAITLSNLPPE